MTHDHASYPKKSILIVDDTRANLYLLMEILAKQGYCLRTVSDGPMALALTKAELPDLILLDIKMPGMSGYDVCTHLKADERTRDIPVIFISALNEIVDKVKAFGLGGVDYITKPFQPEEVLARVKTHLSLRNLQQRLEENNFQLQQEITERKRTQRELKLYSERLEEIVEKRTKELKDAQEQLIRREKLAILGQIAGSIGHELRNPLGAISNAVYFLQMTLTDLDRPVYEYLDLIASEVSHSEKIISDLLDFSRIKSVNKETIMVSAVVAQVLKKQPPPARIHTIITISPDLPPVFVDVQQLEQVLINLIANAYQAMPDGGDVTIFADEVSMSDARGPGIRIQISDTGFGISPENMTKLFEPLFTTKARGVGLGLTISRNLIEANGGTIDVESEDGKGSTFTMILPVSE